LKKGDLGGFSIGLLKAGRTKLIISACSAQEARLFPGNEITFGNAIKKAGTSGPGFLPLMGLGKFFVSARALTKKPCAPSPNIPYS
jgi:hypothetical protein